MIAGLGASPALYPLRIEADRVGVLRLSEADYCAASFLDERLLQDGRALDWRPWREAVAAAPDGQGAHFIFHIGHVGSTLLSRLLGEHPALFSVREPALLRAVADGPLRAELQPLLKLFSRTWRGGQTALIKATSFVSEIAPELMASSRDSCAILLTATPPVYLRTILGGPASRRENAALAAGRQARLERRLGARLAPQGEGERIAMSWLCEAMALDALATQHPERCLWLDFDRLLQDPAAALALCLRHLGVDVAAIDLAALAEGPILRRYAKAPEHGYDADLRRRVLEQAGRVEAAEVERGMAWLQRVAQAQPGARSALLRAAAAARDPLAAPKTAD